MRLICRALEASTSGHHARRSRPGSARSIGNRWFAGEIRRVQARRQGRCGSPRVRAALRAEGRRRGRGRGRVERLVRRHGVRALAGRRFRPCATDSRHRLAVAPNVPARRFGAPAPDRIRLADTTCVPTGEGWLHFAAALDPATRKAVGRAMQDHMRVELALPALVMAARRRRPAPGLVHRSDRGSRHAAEAHVDQLSLPGATASMGRAGCRHDNAPMEGFFHTLKVELVHRRRWATRDEAKRGLFAHIEGHHNRARIHSALGYLTPEQAQRQAG